MADPQPGEQIPGTKYIRCDNKCIKQRKGGGGNDAEKKHCIPAPGADACTPDDDDHPERCHCVPFRKDGDKWKKVKWDSEGYFDDDDEDNPVKCWCVRKKVENNRIRSRRPVSRVAKKPVRR